MINTDDNEQVKRINRLRKNSVSIVFKAFYMNCTLAAPFGNITESL